MLVIKTLLIVLLVYLIYVLIGIICTLYMRYSNALIKLHKKEKRICLTFDDGIDLNYTPRLLDLLKSYDIKATFFILSSTAIKYPEILMRIKNEGHIVGLHSLKHQNALIQLPHQLCLDFKRSLAIMNDLKVSVKYYRPPWGHINPLGVYLCKRYNLKIILWTVIIGDWSKKANKEILCNKLYQKVNSSAVICLHDGRGKNEAPLRTIATLEEMIPYWIKEGYTFETITEFIEESDD